MRAPYVIRLLAVLVSLSGVALNAYADKPNPALPSNLQPLPEPPPPPAGYELDPELEPQVTIVQKDGAQEEQYRVHGRLYMVKVTPAHGVPYYLVDSRGDGVFSRMESLDSGMRVPMWVISNF